MEFLAYLLLFLLVVVAAAFVCWPILREAGQPLRPRALLAAAAAALIFGIGGGLYVTFGHPYLAARTFRGPSVQDYPGLVATLSRQMTHNVRDPRGWLLLARGYAELGDQRDADLAYRRGIAAMVATLSRRLRKSPDDPDGWQRLIRSYAALQQPDDARAALADARRVLANNPAALTALDSEAKELKLPSK